MKRLLFLFTFIAASLFAWAQNNNTRVLIHETNGNVKGYLVERVDSIDFVKITGPVSVEAKFLKYSAGVDGDTIWAAFMAIVLVSSPKCWQTNSETKCSTSRWLSAATIRSLQKTLPMRR